jgi:hypothetical protein
MNNRYSTYDLRIGTVLKNQQKVSPASNGFMRSNTIIIHVPSTVPETFVKTLAILAGILCLCIILLAMVLYNSSYEEVYAFITNTMFGPLTLTLGILAIGTVIMIYLLWHAFWRQV